MRFQCRKLKLGGPDEVPAVVFVRTAEKAHCGMIFRPSRALESAQLARFAIHLPKLLLFRHLPELSTTSILLLPG